MSVAFPKYEKELVRLGKKDQAEIRTHYQKLKLLDSDESKEKLNNQLKAHCHARAERMMEILEEIKQPSISNIGDGSEVISFLALHSYLDVMKKVLKAYQSVYSRNPANVHNESIPSLTDRIMVFEHRTQLYGNNWALDKNGNFFLIPVKDFDQMNQRRATFGLGPRMKPTVYATGENKYPLGKGKAEASDQKVLTDDEYTAFTKGHIR